MTTLVTGATGKIGRRVVHNLLDAGASVRALVRGTDHGLPPEVEVVHGDLTDPAAVAAAVAGVDGVFLYPILDAVVDVVAVARRSGVRTVVMFTGAWAAGLTERDRESWTYPRYRAAEATVTRGGTDEWTVLRPAPFASNLLWWAHTIRAEDVVRAPYAAGASPLIHEDDIAAVAAITLVEHGHAGAYYTLTGPAVISQAEQAAAISHATGRPVRFDELTADAWRDAVSRFIRPGIVGDMLREWSETAADPAAALPVTTTVEDLTGKPARSVAEWAIDHAGAFL